MAYHLQHGAGGFELNDGRRNPWGDVVLGSGLAVLGVVSMVGGLGMIDGGRLAFLWPGLLVVAGGSCLLGPSRARKLTCGTLWIVAGAIMLLSNLGVVAAGPDAVWPVILIALGVDLAVCRAYSPHTEIRSEPDRDSRPAVRGEGVTI